MRKKYSLLIAFSILFFVDNGIFAIQKTMASTFKNPVSLERNENRDTISSIGGDDSIYVAYGIMEKRDIVNATDVVNPGKTIRFDNEQDLMGFLTQKFPSTSGIINLRGLGNALVVIDGVPRDIGSITTDEVEQVTILRDANASVLYGTRGKNGVILITTKKGVANFRKINVTVDKGYSEPIILPKYLGSADYMRLYNEALNNDGLPPLFTEETIANYASGENPYRYPNVDYYSSDFLKKTRPFTRTGFEFSGGNDITQYYTNFGWYNSGSLYKLGKESNANSNRFHMRANVQMKINDYIKASIEGLALFNIYKQPNGNLWQNGATLHPYYFSPLLPTSMIEGNEELLETAKIINNGYILGGTPQYMDNVYGNMLVSGYTQNTQRTVSFGSNIEFDLRKLLEGLKLNTHINIDIYNDFQQSINNLYAVYQPIWETVNGEDKITGLTQIGKDESDGVLNLNSADYYRNTGFYTSLDYKNQFDNLHSFSSTLLGYYSRTKNNFNNYDEKPAHLGLRMAYGYNKRYFIDLSGAYVYSVRLAKGNRGALSPTIGLSWILSEEEWFKNGFLDQLKIKLSAGLINSDVDFGYNLYKSILGGSDFYNYADGLRNTQTLIILRDENKDLTFEKVKSLNFGLEGILFDKSFTLNANIFYMENSGQVIQRQTFPSFFSRYTPYLNYNADSYSGVEIGFNWLKKINDFTINLNGNILFSKSDVKVRDELWQEDYLYRKGRPVSAMFGLEALGFFKNQDDIDKSPVQQFGDVRPGDIKYKDQNGDGIIDSNDEVYLGDWRENISFGINSIIEYKNMGLYIGIHGINGGKAIYSGDYFWNDGFDKYSEVVLDRWTEETADNATYPRLTSGSSSNNFRTSTFWLYDRTYLSINRVQLTYQVPYKLISKIKAKELSIYLRGSNLLMIAQDADKRRIRVGQEPEYRNYALGLRVMF